VFHSWRPLATKQVPLCRSNVYVGNSVRLRRVVQDLLDGNKPVRIGAIGGSITWGDGVRSREGGGATTWFGVVSGGSFQEGSGGGGSWAAQRVRECHAQAASSW
jgi:hypothetical protein